MSINQRIYLGASPITAAAASVVLLTSAAATYFLLRQGCISSYVLPFFLLASVQYFLYGIYKFFLYPFLLSPIRHLPGPKGGNFFLGHFPELLNKPTGGPQIEWQKIPNQGLIRYLGDREQRADNADDAGNAQGNPASEKLHLHQIPRVAFGRRQDSWSNWRNISNSGKSFSRRSPMVTSRTLFRYSGPRPEITLDVIGEAGFGYKFHALESANLDGSVPDSGEDAPELSEAYRTIFTQTPQMRMLALADLVLPSWLIRNLPVQRNRDVAQCSETLRKISLEIIHRKKQEIFGNEKNKSYTQGTADSDDKDKDILSAMIRSGDYDRLEDEDTLIDQIMTFLAAGHVTTSTTLVWALHLLSLKEHRDI
ncbi:hypothetical protein RUND412_006128 [Rhizina undulata]